MLAEIERVLTACPSAKLGLIVTDTEADEHYGYGTYRYSGYRPSRRRARAAAPGGSQRDG
jgi:hypothetical protein